MKKSIISLTVVFGMIASSLAQQSIPGESFVLNQVRFNGRPVRINNVELVKSNATSTPSIGGPIATASLTTSNVSSVQPSPAPCSVPRGHQRVEIFFKGAPEFNACFFMKEAMKTQLDLDMPLNVNAPAELVMRGHASNGYLITAYRLGI
jgi:hypothetical protein